MKTLLILLLLALSACSVPVDSAPSLVDAPSVLEPSPPPIDHRKAHWTISDAFTSTEIETILAAAQAWNEVSNGEIALTFEIASVDGPGPWRIIRGQELEGAAGLTAETRDRFSLNAQAYQDRPCIGELWHIAAHEFGHTFGLDHGGDGIMQRRPPTCDAVFTRSDIDLLNSGAP